MLVHPKHQLFLWRQHHRACCFSLRRGSCWLTAIIGKQAHSSCLPRAAGGEQRPALQLWSRAGLIVWPSKPDQSLLAAEVKTVWNGDFCHVCYSLTHGLPFLLGSLCTGCGQTVNTANPLQPSMQSGHDASYKINMLCGYADKHHFLQVFWTMTMGG